VINVSCVCRLAGVTGYQVIFQFNNPENVESMLELLVKTNSCSNSVLQTVERSGNYCITVFPVRGESGIADSQVSHREEIFIGNSSSIESSPSISGGITCKRCQIMQLLLST
jgi:hypothetical protein